MKPDTCSACAHYRPGGAHVGRGGKGRYQILFTFNDWKKWHRNA